MANHLMKMMDMDIRTFLSHFTKVRQMKPNHWMACCPAHDDKTPSLSITERSDRILIYCHAGCEAEDVLIKAGLSWNDLYRNQLKAAYEQAAHRRIKVDVDPLDVERGVIAIAKARIKKGVELSIDDIARLRLAIVRLGGEE